jgi:hypothetical protein
MAQVAVIFDPFLAQQRCLNMHRNNIIAVFSVPQTKVPRSDILSPTTSSSEPSTQEADSPNADARKDRAPSAHEADNINSSEYTTTDTVGSYPSQLADFSGSSGVRLASARLEHNENRAKVPRTGDYSQNRLNTSQRSVD